MYQNLLNINTIKDCINNKRIVWTEHCLNRLNQRNIMIIDVKNAIQNGKIIEYYYDDYPYQSCLILGKNKNKEYLHIVCGLNNNKVYIITAYYPNRIENKEEKKMNCFMCKGEVEKKKVNYVVELEDTIIIIKEVPAKVCKKCGEKYYDDETSKNIEKIVNQLKELTIEVTVVKYQDNVA